MRAGLRAFSLAFLAWHAGRLLPGLAEPLALVVLVLAGLALGTATRGLRGSLAVALGAGAFAAAWGLLTLVPQVLAGGAASALDTLPLWLDRNFSLGAVPFALGWFEGWAFSGRPERRAWERLVNAAVLAAVFWSQGPYHVTLYPHPLGLAAVLLLFLASEALLLAGFWPRRQAWWGAGAALVAVLALLWTLLGRYEDQSTASGGGLMKPDLFQFDFAPLVRLEDQITLGDNLVLLYREEGPPQRRTLRRLVLDSYDPAQGFSSSGQAPPTVGRRAQTLTPLWGTRERRPVVQDYYLVNLDPSSLLALNEPVRVLPYAQWNQSSFVNAYRVDSLATGDALWLYNDETRDGLTAAQRALYLQGASDPELQAFARQITRGSVTPYEKASAIELYLRDHYLYSLRPGAPGPRGALKHFLFEGKKGYCSYFAFSMTLLLRSLGVPSRIAVGFATDPDEAVLGFTPVRAFQAHAWVEVALGPYGWVEFDPTSQTPAPGEVLRPPKAYDPDDLAKRISEILAARPVPLAEQNSAGGAERAGPDWDRWLAAGRSTGLWLLPLLLLVANEGSRYRWAWRRWRARDEAARWAVRGRELAWRFRRAGWGPRAGETPEAWAQRLQARWPDLTPWAQALSRARYGPPPASGPTAAERDLLRRTLKAADASRPRIQRLAGLVFPWWPR